MERMSDRERWLLQDLTNPYPCQVCGVYFRSLQLLATHPHPAKVTPKLVTRK